MTYFPDLFAKELTIFRIVWAVAWADGELSAAEGELLADFVDRYSGDEILNPLLLQELEQAMQKGATGTSWQELVAALPAQDDRELVLKLTYMMIRISRRSGDEASINADEKVAYRRLVELLALPEERIPEIEWAADAELAGRRKSVRELLGERLRSLFTPAAP